MFAKFKTLFFWLTTPIQKLLQALSRPEPEMTRSQVDAIKKRARRGDLLLSYEGGRLTSSLIPGKWDHLAIINELRMVVEAVPPRVRACDLEEWLFKKKGVALIRYRGNKIVSSSAAIYSNKFLGWLYDYLFKYGNSKAYCSEIGYLSYLEFDDTFMNHIPKGREITPQDFYDAALKGLSNLEIAFEVRN